MHDISALAHVKFNVVIFNGRRCCVINMLIRHSKNLNDVVSFILLDTTILNSNYEIARLHFNNHCPINYDGMSPCLMFSCSAIRPPPMPSDFYPTHA
jgi:hypothetical protein